MTPIEWTLAAGTALLGALTWTLLEYVIHRFAGHERPHGNPFGAEHLKHHATTHYFAPSWKKAAVATPVIAGFAALVAMATGATLAIAYSGGLAVMYLAYEVAHRRAHTHGPTGPYSRWLRRHHFHHHFRSPNRNHGVTSPFWDHVFGTFEEPGVVRVPEKHAMVWLVDRSTGDVWPRYAGDYAIARRGDKKAA